MAKNLTPIALVGAGGIGKTSIALTVLHHSHIKEQFGDNRRFIRCDKFPATSTHFLNQLSMVVGAGVKNPRDLTPLRPFLSSKEMILILDNAESILDPQGMNAQEIYAIVEELVQFETICLCITSRISTVPRYCKRPVICTLSLESACNIFYSIYDNGGQSDVINNILRQLDFHALSITLLATTASHNMWDHYRLAQEWDRYHVEALQTDYNESLAATIELSLASPTFHKLGPNARDLLGVIAFFPQGINEDNLGQLFPTISGRRTIFDRFCVLSLTNRTNGFITMLAPLQDYLRPKDPSSSELLCITKDCYFKWLSVDVSPDKPGFEGSQWIRSEDMNVEHLLDTFTSIGANSADVWDACGNFMEHLYWHKRRLVVLGTKIEGLPDSHPSKPKCLYQLSCLFDSVGNHVERKRLLNHTLVLWREQGDSIQIAQTLVSMSDANRRLGHHKEGIQQVEEALEIYKQLNHTSGQAQSLQQFARLLYAERDGYQLDAAEKAALQAIDLLPENGEQFQVCRCYRILGDICYSNGRKEEAANHFNTALEIASTFNWDSEQFWGHHSLAWLLFGEKMFTSAHIHIEHAKSHAVHDPYLMGRVMGLQARIFYEECRFEEAKSEALHAVDVFEKLGAMDNVEYCRAILQDIEALTASGISDVNGELLETVLLPSPNDRPFLAHSTE